MVITIRHATLGLIAVLIVMLLILEPARPQHAHTAAAPAALTLPIIRPLTRGEALSYQDPQDHDLRLGALQARDLHDRPAFQHLPLRGRHLTVQIIGASRDGRALLLIHSDLGCGASMRLYEHWLARLHDGGHAYIHRFQGCAAATRQARIPAVVPADGPLRVR